MGNEWFVMGQSNISAWVKIGSAPTSGGIAAGYNVGLGASAGLVTGDESNIQGITYNTNAGGTSVGGTAMFDQSGLVGFTAGPSADIGASASYAQTGAAGLGDFGRWLGGWLYDKLHPKTCP